MKANYE